MRVVGWIVLFLALVFVGGTWGTYDVGDFDNQKVQQLFEEKKYEEADAIVSKYLEEYPEDSVALGSKAYILIEQDRNEEGILILNRLLLEDPEDDTTLNNLSWAYNNLELYQIALDYAEQALEIEPMDDYQLLNKGNALYRL